MKSLAFPLLLLLLLTTEALSQIRFYPIEGGNRWLYWESGFPGGFADTITVSIHGDTTLGGKAYRILSQVSSRYPDGSPWLTFVRADSSGDVFRWDASAGRDSLCYRLSDTSKTWWMSYGRLHRFDSCVVKEIFGKPRKVLYVGAYDAADTSLQDHVLLVDSIGYYTSVFYGAIGWTRPSVLLEARINGVYYGPSPEVKLAGDFYPLELENRWNYHLKHHEGYSVRDSSNVAISVIGDTLMPNGHVYAQLSQWDVLEASFVRSDSSYVYYYSPFDERDVPMYNLRGPAGTWDSVLWAGGGVVYAYVSSVTEDSLFGVRRVSRTYSFGGLVSYEVTLTDGIGITRASNMGDGGYYTTNWSIRGAVIRDTIYGVPVRVAEVESTPLSYTLFQNYPNPFNPSTTIRYALPHRSHVTLTVYNTVGQLVAKLINGNIEAGSHEVIFDATRLASGVYFYRIQAEDFTQTRKLCLIR